MIQQIISGTDLTHSGVLGSIAYGVQVQVLLSSLFMGKYEILDF